MRRLSVFTAVFLFASALGAASAEAMTCRQRLVREGDDGSRVLELCGEPTEVVQRTESRSHTVQRVAPDGTVLSNTFTVTVVVEQWTYDLGPQRFMRRLIFEDGVLLRIDTLGYGTVGHSAR